MDLRAPPCLAHTQQKTAKRRSGLAPCEPCAINRFFAQVFHMNRCFHKLCFLFALGLSFAVNVKANIDSSCDTFPLANVTNFSVQEIYDGASDSTQIQVADTVRLAAACVLSVKEGESGVAYIGFIDEQSFLYDAAPDPLHNYQNTIAKYAVRRGCPAPDGGAYMLDRGYFNAIPQRNSVTREMTDYAIDDGAVSASIARTENLEGLVIFRDSKGKIVTLANRTGTQWQIDNPGKLSPAHIGFVLTHKLNRKSGCWGNGDSGNNGGAQGPGFWPSIGIAVGVTAAVTGVIALAVTVTCKVCEKHRCLNRYQAVPMLEHEMESRV